MSQPPAEKLLSFLEKRPLCAWALVAAYAAVIFAFSSMSSPPQPIETHDRLEADIISSVEHLTEYAIFGFLLLSAFRSLGGRFADRSPLLALAAATLYGATDEIHQYFVPNRECSITDLSVDFIGASIGILSGKHKRP